MKVEVEVLQDFGDFVYGKPRKAGDKFVCDKEMALKRQKMEIKGEALVKILRVVDDDTPEEEKVSTDFLNLFKEKMINKKREENEEDINENMEQ